MKKLETCRHAFVAMLLGCGMAGVAAADLYTGTVAVANESATERARALPIALQEVLVKVSGSTDTANQPEVRDALGSAADYVIDSSYRQQVRSGSNGVNSTILNLVASFNTESVNGLLRRAGKPVWTTQRPRLLVWLVIESGTARQVASSTQTAALGALMRTAEERGFDLILPEWDYTDQARASIESLWLGDLRSVKAASTRYGTTAALLARLRRTDDGWNSRYSLIALGRNSRSEEWQAIHPSASAALEGAVAGSANRLAARYAISPEDLVNGTYTVRVDRVHSGSDYGRTLAYLKELDVVRDIEPVGARSDQLELRVDLGVTPRRLAAILAADEVLDVVRVPGSDTDSASAEGDQGYAVASAGALPEPEPDSSAIPRIAESFAVVELTLRPTTSRRRD